MVATGTKTEILINTLICIPLGIIMLVFCYWLYVNNRRLVQPSPELNILIILIGVSISGFVLWALLLMIEPGSKDF
jgi:hypothetical protein